MSPTHHRSDWTICPNPYIHAPFCINTCQSSDSACFVLILFSNQNYCYIRFMHSIMASPVAWQCIRCAMTLLASMPLFVLDKMMSLAQTPLRSGTFPVFTFSTSTPCSSNQCALLINKFKKKTTYIEWVLKLDSNVFSCIFIFYSYHVSASKCCTCMDKRGCASEHTHDTVHHNTNDLRTVPEGIGVALLIMSTQSSTVLSRLV